MSQIYTKEHFCRDWVFFVDHYFFTITITPNFYPWSATLLSVLFVFLSNDHDFSFFLFVTVTPYPWSVALFSSYHFFTITYTSNPYFCSVYLLLIFFWLLSLFTLYRLSVIFLIICFLLIFLILVQKWPFVPKRLWTNFTRPHFFISLSIWKYKKSI